MNWLESVFGLTLKVHSVVLGEKFWSEEKDLQLQLSSFSWLKKQTELKDFILFLLCLYVADPAAFLASHSVLGSENSLFIHLWIFFYYYLINSVNWIPLQPPNYDLYKRSQVILVFCKNTFLAIIQHHDSMIVTIFYIVVRCWKSDIYLGCLPSNCADCGDRPCCRVEHVCEYLVLYWSNTWAHTKNLTFSIIYTLTDIAVNQH